jgi:hypothetical protein
VCGKLAFFCKICEKMSIITKFYCFYLLFYIFLALELVDSLNPFSEGIFFRFWDLFYLIIIWTHPISSVRPPKKSWKQIGNLSGGEKTLASLALVFGLHGYRPSPLYVCCRGPFLGVLMGLIIFAKHVKNIKNSHYIGKNEIFCQLWKFWRLFFASF